MPSYWLIALAVALLLGGFCRAAGADVLSKSGRIELPAEPLADAINKLALQIDVDIIYELGSCGDFMTPDVRGILTVRQALDRLLRGTQLHYEFVDDRSVRVRLPTAQEVAKLAPTGTRRRSLCGVPGTSAPTPRERPIETPGPETPVIITGTGTNFRPGVATDSPVASFSQDSLEQSGYYTLPDFFSHYAPNLSSNSRATYGIGDGHNGQLGTGINLFGLGEQATLVLVNGHRVANSALGDFVDIALIPMAAVERVDILTGADAAIYGADAVGGVVNIILRKNFSGADVSVRYSVPYDSDATELSVAPTLGTSWGSGNVVAAVMFNRDRPLLGTDRPYSNASGFDLTPGVRDYQGFLYVTQEVRSGLALSVDGLYSKRYTLDDINYVRDGSPIGPYVLNGTTDQYLFAPALTWAFATGWDAILDFDLSESRSAEVTSYGATGSAAGYTTLNESRERTVDLRANGTIPGAPGGDAMLVAGVGGRWEDYDSAGTVTAALSAGSFARHVAAGYSEIHVPLIGKDNAHPFLNRLDFMLAVRAERYSDIGSSVTPKAGVSWQPVDTLRIHGTYGTSFSAARYSDTLQTFNSLIVQSVASPACASGSCLVAEEFGAHSQYQPEKSRSFDAGVDWSPEHAAGVKVRSSAYLIRYRDQIAMPPDVATLISRAAAFPGIVVMDPSRSYMDTVLARAAGYPQGIVDLAGGYTPGAFDFYVDERIRNLAETVAAGADFNVDYEFKGALGTWNLGLEGTRVLRLDERASAVSPLVPVADTFAHPVSKHYEGYARLKRHGVEFSASVGYVGRYANDLVDPAVAIASWTTVDVAVEVPLDGVLPGVFEGSLVQLTVRNLFNREPPYASNPLVPLGYDPVNASAMGRVVGVRVGVRW